MAKIKPVRFYGGMGKAVQRLITKKAEGQIIHLCSGRWNYGITIDLVERADIRADVCHLPLRDLVADTVICDPPYEGMQCHELRGGHSRLYQASVSDRSKLMQEIRRITRVGGLIAFLHWYIPPLGRGYKVEDVFMVTYGAYRRIRALSFTRKVQGILNPDPLRSRGDQ